MSIKVLLVMALINGSGDAEQATVRGGFPTEAECNRVLLSLSAPDLPEGYHVKAECVDISDWLIIKAQEVEKLHVNPA
jgi:hypothetical protein